MVELRDFKYDFLKNLPYMTVFALPNSHHFGINLAVIADVYGYYADLPETHSRDEIYLLGKYWEKCNEETKDYSENIVVSE